MINLDDQKIYKKLDTGQVAKSIELLADQVRQVLDESRLVKIPTDYSKVTQVVVNGMGGSNIGVYIAKSVFADQIKIPITITPGYQIPASVDKKTLYLISSYSGTTEEPLSVYREVKKRGAKIMAITMDSPKSKLARLMLKENIPGYIFKPQFNPSNQPRLGLGYSIFGVAVLLAKAGLFKIIVQQIEEIIASLEIWDRELRPEIKTGNNLAKQLALKLYGKQPVLVAGEFLAGNVHALRNQFCENSKNFTSYLVLPDLNHFALESLANPVSNKNNLIFFFFDSIFYHPRIIKRSRLTKQIVKKNRVAYVNHLLKGVSKLEQAFEMLQLGCWTTYYLAMLNQANPVKIPWVDWFKKQLGD